MGSGDAVTSAGPYANNLHLAPDTTPTPHHSTFIGRMLFLMPNQQCFSTEGTSGNCHVITMTARLAKGHLRRDMYPRPLEHGRVHSSSLPDLISSKQQRRRHAGTMRAVATITHTPV